MPDIFDEVVTAPQEAPISGDIFDEVTTPTRKREKAEKVAKGFKFFGFQPTAEQIEPIRRKAGIGLKEFAGGAFGLPGDVLSLIQTLTGIKKPVEILPTGETIRTGFEKLAKEEFKPETRTEQIIGDISGLAGAIALPIGGVPKASTILLGSTLPVFVKEGLKEIGAPKAVQTGASILTMLAVGLKGGKKPLDVSKELFKKAESAIPKGTTVTAKDLLTDATKIEKILEKGIKGVPSKAAPLKVINEIKSKAKDGKIAVDELLSFKRDINELRSSLFAEGVSKEGIVRARSFLNPLSKSVDKAIESFGKTNPEFPQDFRKANKLFGEIQDVPKVIQFLERKVDWKGKDPLTLAFLAFKPKAFVSAYGISKGGKLLDRLIRKPTIRKLYLQAINQSLKQNVKGTSKVIKKLDEEVKKEKKNF